MVSFMLAALHTPTAKFRHTTSVSQLGGGGGREGDGGRNSHKFTACEGVQALSLDVFAFILRGTDIS